jgi:hypothetical protein
MDHFVLLIFSFFAVVSIGMLVFFIGPEASGMGVTVSAAPGEKPGNAVNVLKYRIIGPGSLDGVPKQGVLRDGALETTGVSACPEGYRLANRYECRFVKCIPVAADFAEMNLGKMCKPIIVSPPVYPEEGILK